MVLVFIHGPAASGKLTIGRELQTLTGFRLFHNHLVVDTLLAVFPFGSDPFVRLREQMWLSVFKEAAAQDISLIFTFAPERTVRASFIDEAIRTVTEGGGRVLFVELTCPIEELERRLDNPSRAQFMKLRSVELFRQLRRYGMSDVPRLPSSGLSIDTSTTRPDEAAKKIRDFFNFAAEPQNRSR